jgi:hypothetical protein
LNVFKIINGCLAQVKQNAEHDVKTFKAENALQKISQQANAKLEPANPTNSKLDFKNAELVSKKLDSTLEIEIVNESAVLICEGCKFQFKSAASLKHHKESLTACLKRQKKM